MRAFTLIELLTVLMIMAILAAMVIYTNPRQGKAQTVELAAEGVASMLRRARAMAIVEQAPITVSFNIQNAPGSSGRVLNNRSGGHWLRLLRPARAMIGNNSGFGTDAPPLICGGKKSATSIAAGAYAPWHVNSSDATSGNAEIYSTFAHIAEEIRADWISDRYTLPAGHVRFLALGDSDEGPRMHCSAKGYGYGPTHPRPYFGWYDAASKRLYPWGGYDPALPPVASYTAGWPAVANYTGLFYQGHVEAPIPDSRNPETRVFQVDWNGDGAISGTDAQRGPENAWTLYEQGSPRPLVNGEWGDFTIVFEADGSVNFPAMKCNRRFYTYTQGALRTYLSTGTAAMLDGCAPSDQAKAWSYYVSGGDGISVPNGESIHYMRHTDRVFITLAPDARTDTDTFDTPQQALQSMWPMYRVHVNALGSIGVTRVAWEEGVLERYGAAGWKTWPASPSVYEMASTTDRDWIEQNFKYGWPHQRNTSADAAFWSLKPIGRPIADEVSTAMLTRRIWWLLP